MYTIQSQTPIANNALAHHKELQCRIQRNSLGELCPGSCHHKPSFLKQALSFVNSMVNAGQQLKGHYQAL